MRIGVVAPSGRFVRESAERVTALAAQDFPGVELVFHPQCFMEDNHFAGSDDARFAAFVAAANDPSLDAIWFARGGYGACRIAEEAVAALDPAARDKAYLGYSDGGYLLAGLYKAGFPHVAHGPVVHDIARDGGVSAVRRALAWLTERSPDALEPGLERGTAYAAFNLTVFGLLTGTALEPDLGGHVLLVEDVAEHAYRTDRALFHITGQPQLRRIVGLRLGRVSDIPENDPDFGATSEEIARYWCERSGIPFLGRADIGHDADNKVVPFGVF
ncbi:MAG: LD-carboxypeptidase [Allosphingosinicella sp.]|uniref:LD-carboxypeptidase n=1 Tax=Allosphingosinicella sp. TaxID=2823234 RepID=UPI0039630FE3